MRTVGGIEERLGRPVTEASDRELAAIGDDPSVPFAHRNQARAELDLRIKFRTSAETPGMRVTIAAIDIPFGDVVWLMVKWVLAAIPALIILTVLAGAAMLALAAGGTLVK